MTIWFPNNSVFEQQSLLNDHIAKSKEILTKPRKDAEDCTKYTRALEDIRAELNLYDSDTAYEEVLIFIDQILDDAGF